ncbi:hypothetical protein FQN54_000030 [Arachnomyces sp. PD_36]|nr:hypothetical protein FQN54_000030 [Arachnomyces sp. PD_36]
MSSAELDKYEYESLPTESSIRLFRITGRDATGRLRCSMKTVDLDDNPRYHCLSYTWMSPPTDGILPEEISKLESTAPDTSLSPIVCDGKVLHIHSNLHNILSNIPTDVWSTRMNKKGKRGRTSIIWSAISGKDSLVRECIGSGADVNAQDDDGRSPLHYAAGEGDFDIVKTLVSAGIDTSLLDIAGKSAMDYAVEFRRVEIIEYLDNPPRQVEVPLGKCPDDPSLWIWIDALCINQEDVDERSSQVGMMDIIFQRAIYTTVWLGNENHHVEAAAQTIKTLAAVEHNKFLYSDIIPFSSQDRGVYELAGIPYISLDDWKSLAALLLRRWFRRSWVIQEVILSQDLIMFCGGHEILFRELALVASLIQVRDRIINQRSSLKFIPIDSIAVTVETNLCDLVRWRELCLQRKPESSKQFTLIRLLLDTVIFQSSDPRDKIYSLYGLLNFAGNSKPTWVPDYSKSTAQCFAEATKAIIQQEGDMGILCALQDHSARTTPDLPSWVPDYALPYMNMMTRYFDAAKGLPFTILPSEFWETLPVRAVKLDTITNVGNDRREGPNSMFYFDPSWFELLSELEPVYRAGGYRTEALWRTLCANQDTSHKSPAPAEFAALFRELVSAMISGEIGKEEKERFTPRDREIDPELIHALEETSIQDGDHPYQPEDLSHALGATLERLNSFAQSEPEPCTPTLPQLDAFHKSPTFRLWDKEGYVNQPEDHSFFAAMSMRYANRRLYITNEKYIGLGPISLKAGDSVWIIPGAGGPFVLRPCGGDGEGGRFLLIGETYVHGVMNGEAAEGMGRGDLEEIELC